MKEMDDILNELYTKDLRTKRGNYFAKNSLYGILTNPKYQGNGYATEAASVVLRFMFEEVGIEQIVTSAAIVNQGSWRIMEKVGFVRVGEKDSPYTDKSGKVIKAYRYVIDKERYNNT